MLKHEPAEVTTPTAADARVTPAELTAALKTLEDRQSSTVAIGSVVDELRLNATPEQIWEQVQQQRAQAATAQTPPGQTDAEMSPLGRCRWIWMGLAAAIAYIYAHFIAG